MQISCCNGRVSSRQKAEGTRRSGSSGNNRAGRRRPARQRKYRNVLRGGYRCYRILGIFILIVYTI